MNAATDDSTYLGLPNILGRNKSVILGFLKEKVRARIQSWDSKLLSRAGKEILLKTVIQAMPNYAMGVFLLPMELCKDIERMMSRFWWKSSPRKDRGIHWMSWERMCKPKGHGGLGFKCLRSFNIALLGKQGWRLLVNPDSLVSQIFKARYYPDGTFLTAKLGSNPSFVWRSIVEAHELVRQGVGWRIRSGKQVNVLNEPWLLNEVDPFVSSRHPALVGCRVENLMVEGGCEWDEEIISDLFSDKEAAAILAIPLPQGDGDDNLFWRAEKSGEYSVKSAYRTLKKTSEGVDEEADSKFWQKLWKIKAPPKIKNFLWRCATNCLPTRALLRGRRVEIDPLCAQCNQERETTLHCIVGCSFASSCWIAAGFFGMRYEGASFAGWLRMFFQILDEDGMCKTAMLCWAIWRARNDLIWKKRKMTVNEVVTMARIELGQWRSAKEKGVIPSFSIPDSRDGAERWSTPDENMIKVNVDAAIFADSESFGVGWVARGHDGRLIEGGTLTKGGSISPGVAEAVGVREALSWIKRKGWKEVILETDCLEVVQAARSKVAMRSYFGSIISECRSLLHEMSDVVLIFVRRSANRVAHELARASYLMSDRIVRAGSLPDDIHAFVLDDLSN